LTTVIVHNGMKEVAVGMMDLYCHSYLLRGTQNNEFIPGGIDWGIKPNAVQWLLAGKDGVQNAVRFAKALVDNGGLVPKPGSDWEKIVAESNKEIERGSRSVGVGVGGDADMDTLAGIIDEQLLRLGTAMEYLKE